MELNVGQGEQGELDLDGNEEKLCWICYRTPNELPNAAWVRPCKCRGSMEWVHQSCLQTWIETSKNRKKPFCRHCHCTYVIQYPFTNIVVTNFESFYRFADENSTLFCRFLSLANTGRLARHIFRLNVGLDINGGNNFHIEAAEENDANDDILQSYRLFNRYLALFSVLCVPLWHIEAGATELLLQYTGVVKEGDKGLAADRSRFSLNDFVKNIVVVPICARALGVLIYNDTYESPVLEAFVCTSIVLVTKTVANVCYEYVQVARSKETIVLDYNENN